MPYIGKSPGKLGVRTRYHYTATGSETSKSGSDDNGLTLKFDDGEYVDVYLNGSLLVAGSDYNTATANTISGLTALASNDILEVVVYDIYSLAKVNSEAQRTVYHKTASGGETSISGADDSGATITFPANAIIDVYLNGVKLKQGDDYNTTTANTVGGLTALTAGQLVAITVFEKFVLADMVKISGDTMTGGLSAPSITSTGGISGTTGTFSSDVNINGDLNVDSNTLKVDAANNKIGINGIPVNTGASLPIVDLHGGQGDNGILIRTGDTNTASGGGTVLQVGFNTGTGYRHNIRTRHDSGNNVNNAIEFYTWQTGQNSGDLGNLKVLSAGATGVTMPQNLAVSSFLNTNHTHNGGGAQKVTNWSQATGTSGPTFPASRHHNSFDYTNSRFVAPVTGLYMMVYKPDYDRTITTNHYVSFGINGATRNFDVLEDQPQYANSGTNYQAYLQLNANDYVELYTQGGATYGLKGSAGYQWQTWWFIIQLS